MYRILIVFFLLSCQQSSSQTKPWVVATYRYAENERIDNIRPLADHLAQQLNHPVLVRSYPTVHEFVYALQHDEVDVALINTFGFLLLDNKSHNMVPLAVLQPKEGTQDNYKTAILARKETGVNSMDALSRMSPTLRLVLVSPGSTSGNLVPRLAMSRLGLTDPEIQFLQLRYSGNHRLAIDSLLAGKADVCAVGSTEYFKLVADSIRASQCNLLWLSPEIPLGPLLVHRRLGKEMEGRITAALLSLHKENTIALDAVKKGWSEAKEAEKYILFSPSYYTPFLEQIGSKEAVAKILVQFAN